MADENANSDKENKEELLPKVQEIEVEEVVDELKKKPSLKDLSEEQLRDIARVSIVEVRQEIFSGPLPPPSLLAAYENIIPGCADRIIKMSEANANSRLTINDKIVTSDIKRSNRGQVLGFVLSIIGIGAAVFCAYLKQPLPASLLGVGGLSTIISIFVLNRK